MCTLVFGLDVLGAGSILVATNRDENPARPSEPPQVLVRSPRVVGGRDALAGGTWLALRAASPGREPGVALLLNRRDPEPGRPGRRSRGLLALDVAAADDPKAAALAEAEASRYAPFSLVWLARGGSWLLALRHGEAPSLAPVAPGWHALAHHELDDPGDLRTSWLAGQLEGFRPRTRAEAEARLRALISTHAHGAAPPVCIHGGPAPTVSAALLWLAPGETDYRHAPGPSCVAAFEDCGALLTD